MQQREYIKAVIRRLECSARKKTDIEKELASDIQTAVAEGESWDEIQARMGTPEQLAKEFNDNLTPEEIRNNKKKKGLVTAGIIVGILVLLGAGIIWMLPKSYELEKSGIFKEATVLEQTDTIIGLLDQEDYTGLEEYADDKMKGFFQRDANVMAGAKAALGGELGANQGYTSWYAVEIRQSGKRYAMVQVVVQYENRSVTYTITYDEEMKLSGLYMK